jgi:hypothetical protein
MDAKELVRRLRALQRWDCDLIEGDWGETCAQMDQSQYGEYVRQDDMEDLLKEFEAGGY